PCRGRPGRAHKPGRGLLSTCCLGQEVRPIAPGCPPAAGCVCSCAPGSMGEVPEVCVVPVRSAHPHRPTPPGEVPAAAGRSPDVYRASCHPHGGHFVLRRGDTPPWSGGLAHAGPRLVHPRGCRALEEGEVAVPPHRSWQKNPLLGRVFPPPVEGHAGKPSGEKTTARGRAEPSMPSHGRCTHSLRGTPTMVPARGRRLLGRSLARLRPRADQRLRGDQSMGSSSTTTSKLTSSPSTEVVVTVTP